MRQISARVQEGREERNNHCVETGDHKVASVRFTTCGLTKRKKKKKKRKRNHMNMTQWLTHMGRHSFTCDCIKVQNSHEAAWEWEVGHTRSHACSNTGFNKCRQVLSRSSWHCQSFQRGHEAGTMCSRGLPKRSPAYGNYLLIWIASKAPKCTIRVAFLLSFQTIKKNPNNNKNIGLRLGLLAI